MSWPKMIGDLDVVEYVPLLIESDYERPIIWVHCKSCRKRLGGYQSDCDPEVTPAILSDIEIDHRTMNPQCVVFALKQKVE